jgi:hypothetical protein
MDGNDSDGGDKGDYFNPEEEIGIAGSAKVFFIYPERIAYSGDKNR